MMPVTLTDLRFVERHLRSMADDTRRLGPANVAHQAPAIRDRLTELAEIVKACVGREVAGKAKRGSR
jgi:hypothetical protein